MVQSIKRHIPILGALLVAVLAIVACGSGSSTASYETVAPANITAGDAKPAPTGDVVLTLFGDIGVTNSGDTLQLDMPTLEGFGLVKYAVNDPWLEATNTYTGVLMSDLRRSSERLVTPRACVFPLWMIILWTSVWKTWKSGRFSCPPASMETTWTLKTRARPV